MAEVKEQGATRWARPSDYGDRPKATPADRHQPRTPSSPAPGRPVQRPDWKPTPLKPDTGFPDHAKPFPKPKPVPPPRLPMPGSPIPAGRVGVGLGGAIRAGGIAGALFAGIDIVDHYWRRLPYPEPNPKNGWSNHYACPNPPTPPDTGGGKYYEFNSCLDSQAGSQLEGGVIKEPAGNRYGLWWWQNRGSLPAAERFAHRHSWSRGNASRDGPQVEPALIRVRPVTPGYNPNVARGQPSGRPNPMPQPYADPRLDPVGPGSSPVRIGRQFRPGQPASPIPPSPRKPPKKNERQGKAISRSQAVMLAFFKALDLVSEAAEVVDAIYDALPDKVKKRWDCDGFKAGRHPLLDTAGQYGIDRADCKAKAIWHNNHSIDIQTAVENIIKNHLSDKFVGAMHRILPNNTGSAMEQGEIALNKLIDDYLSQIIDLDRYKTNAYQKGYF